jgi:hypothetical protein
MPKEPTGSNTAPRTLLGNRAFQLGEYLLVSITYSLFRILAAARKPHINKHIHVHT